MGKDRGGANLRFQVTPLLILSQPCIVRTLRAAGWNCGLQVATVVDRSTEALSVKINSAVHQFVGRLVKGNLLNCSGWIHSSRTAATGAPAWLSRHRYFPATLKKLSKPMQWTDAFQPDRGDGRTDVAFEKAALLFNLGAIASQVLIHTASSVRGDLTASRHSCEWPHGRRSLAGGAAVEPGRRRQPAAYSIHQQMGVSV